MTKRARIWVSPEFKNMIKKEAVSNNMNILEYTEKIAKEKGGNLKELKINSFWSRLI